MLNIVSGYLYGCTQGNIQNQIDLESRLKPADWS